MQNHPGFRAAASSLLLDIRKVINDALITLIQVFMSCIKYHLLISIIKSSLNQYYRFLKFHNMLYDFFQGDSVKMRHWLRVKDGKLEGTPFILIVDNNKLEDVILHLSNLKSSEA